MPLSGNRIETIPRDAKRIMDSVSTFLQAVRRSRLLNPVRLNELKLSLVQTTDDPDLLAEQLVRRGWLTFYQVEQLLAGHDQELVLDSYHLLKLLGQGGLCQVFKALDTRT